MPDNSTGRYLVIRDRDGMPLAASQRGAGRASLEKTADVFRSLGVPCKVFSNLPDQHINESRFIALARAAERERRKRAAKREAKHGKQDFNA